MHMQEEPKPQPKPGHEPAKVPEPEEPQKQEEPEEKPVQYKLSGVSAAELKEFMEEQDLFL